MIIFFAFAYAFDTCTWFLTKSTNFRIWNYYLLLRHWSISEDVLLVCLIALVFRVLLVLLCGLRSILIWLLHYRLLEISCVWIRHEMSSFTAWWWRSCLRIHLLEIVVVVRRVVISLGRIRLITVRIWISTIIRMLLHYLTVRYMICLSGNRGLMMIIHLSVIVGTLVLLNWRGIIVIWLLIILNIFLIFRRLNIQILGTTILKRLLVTLMRLIIFLFFAHFIV